MDTLSFKTKSARKSDIKKDWYVVDADGKTLGRMSSQIASILRGKNKPSYTPHVDTGDYVVVINAEKVHLSGNKVNAKEYLTYSGYQGGQKSITPKELLKKHPERIVEKAVKGMLPKNKLGNAIAKKLFVYVGPEHPHSAQQPKELKIKS